MNRQFDLFPTTEDISAPPQIEPIVMAERVRPRLASLLAEVRSAERMPWDAQRTQVNVLLFHNMANWLPPEERECLRAEFRAELERLGLPAAATPPG